MAPCPHNSRSIGPVEGRDQTYWWCYKCERTVYSASELLATPAASMQALKASFDAKEGIA